MKLDLTGAEIDELDGLLAQTPAPLHPLDVVMLDGFVCGVLVQPRWISPAQWLPHVFDMQARPLPAAADPGWRARCERLVLRHAEALNRELAEDGTFDPVLHEDPPEPSDPAVRDALREMPAHARVLLPWAAGFEHACLRFPSLLESSDEAIVQARTRILRHLPGRSDDERRLLERLEREQPLATLQDAIDDVVLAVAELWELTQDERFRVETVRREVPKVGRNDPCPCGSGRKYKLCHGAG